MELDGLVGEQKKALEVLESIEELYQEHLGNCGGPDTADHRVQFYSMGIEVFEIDENENEEDQMFILYTLRTLYYTYTTMVWQESVERARIASQN